MTTENPGRSAEYDAVVVGAGPAGCTHALALDARGALVLLAGPRPCHPPGTRELVDGRAAADLDALGLLSRLQAVSRSRAGTLSRWGTADFASRSSLLDPAGPGWIVDRNSFDVLLRDAVRDAGIQITD